MPKVATLDRRSSYSSRFFGQTNFRFFWRSSHFFPRQAELLQYERRFTELSALISAKLDETKKYFALYNSSEEVHRMMQQECAFLNQIIEAFPKASKARQQMMEFIDKMEQLCTGVEQQKHHQSVVLQGDQQALTARVQLHQRLLDQQHQYYRLVRDFQEECSKNEALLGMAQEHQIQL